MVEPGDNNGSNVTWRELNLIIYPLRDDLKEVKADVKLLLNAAAEAVAVGHAEAREVKNAVDRRNLWTSIVASSVTSLLVAMLGLIIYIIHP